MHLKIDTNGTTFVAASEPEALLDFETQVRRVGKDGRPLSIVRVVAFADGGAEVLKVRVAGEVAGVSVGAAVSVNGLTATTWEVSGRHGISFQADSLAPTTNSGRSAGSKE